MNTEPSCHINSGRGIFLEQQFPVTINGKVYPKLAVTDVEKVIAEYRKMEE